MKSQSLHSNQSIKRLSDYPDVLTVQEASEILGVCTKTIYKMIKQGNLKKQNVGRLFRIPNDATEDITAKCPEFLFKKYFIEVSMIAVTPKTLVLIVSCSNFHSRFLLTYPVPALTII